MGGSSECSLSTLLMVRIVGVCGHLGGWSAASEQGEEKSRKGAGIHYTNPDWHTRPDWTMRSVLCAVSKSDSHTFPHRNRSPGTRLRNPASRAHPVSPEKTKAVMSYGKMNDLNYH
jgi:hypothetical protein